MRLDIKDPSEKITLTFDFSVGLGADDLLTGTPTAAVVVLMGRDVDPAALLNGAPAIDGTSTRVYLPVQAGSEGCDYVIKVECATTSPYKVLALSAVLPVRSLN